jgi:hypothetical protein
MARTPTAKSATTKSTDTIQTIKHNNEMKQQYMGISGKVSHSPQLTTAYNNLLEQLGTEGMLILIERWMDDNDIESIIQYNENN